MPEDRKFIPIDAVDSSSGAPTAVQDTPRKFIPLNPMDIIKIPITKAPPLPGNMQYPSPDLGDDLKRGALQTLPILGGVGGAFAGPAGAAVGAGVGSTVRDIFTHKMDTGENLPFGDQAISFAKNTALAGAGGKISELAAGAFPGAQGKLASIIANTVFGQAQRSTENAIRGGPSDESSAVFKDFLTNAGLEIVGGKLVKMGVNKTPEGKSAVPEIIQLGEGFGRQREQAKIGSGPLQQSTPPSRNTEEIGTAARNTVSGNFKRATEIEKQLHTKFETNHLEANSIDIPQFKGYKDSGILDSQGNKVQTPILENAHISGPIYTSNATKLAGDFQPKLDALVGGPEFSRLPEYQQGKLKAVRDAVSRLTEGVPTYDPKTGNSLNLPILDYNAVKQIRTDINQSVGGLINKTFGEGGLTKLASALGQDVDQSIQGWKNPKIAQSDLAAANSATQFKNRVFGDEIQRRLFATGKTGQLDKRLPGDASDFLQDAYTSPEKAKRMMDALGPENHGLMKEDYLDNQLLQKGFGTNFNKFTPRGIIDELENPNSVSRTILNADERNNMLRFMRAAESSVSGKNAISFQAGTVSFALGSAARAVTGNPLAGAVVRFGSREFIHKMVETPAAFEYATRLVKLPPNGQGAEQLSKLLLKSMRGTEVTLTTGEKKQDGFINDAGKIQLKEE